MATDPKTANEPFNITNGDIFRWQDMWPAIAASPETAKMWPSFASNIVDTSSLPTGHHM